MNRRSFRGDTIYKVRRISTGLYFDSEFRLHKWEPDGRVYQTPDAAVAVAMTAREKVGEEYVAVPFSDLEIVEFRVTEVAAHPLLG
jgi:hypothetical protein